MVNILDNIAGYRKKHEARLTDEIGKLNGKGESATDKDKKSLEAKQKELAELKKMDEEAALKRKTDADKKSTKPVDVKADLKADAKPKEKGFMSKIKDKWNTLSTGKKVLAVTGVVVAVAAVAFLTAGLAILAAGGASTFGGGLAVAGEATGAAIATAAVTVGNGIATAATVIGKGIAVAAKATGEFIIGSSVSNAAAYTVGGMILAGGAAGVGYGTYKAVEANRGDTAKTAAEGIIKTQNEQRTGDRTIDRELDRFDNKKLDASKTIVTMDQEKRKFVHEKLEASKHDLEKVGLRTRVLERLNQEVTKGIS